MNQPPTAQQALEGQLKEVLECTYPGTSKPNTHRRNVALEWFCYPNNSAKNRTLESVAGKCGISHVSVHNITKEATKYLQNHPDECKRLTESISIIGNHLKQDEYVFVHDEFVKGLADAGITSTPLVFEGIAELAEALNHSLPVKVVKSPSKKTEFIIRKELGKGDIIAKICKRAGKLATLYGGVYPYEAFLLDEACDVIPASQRKHFVQALLESELDYKSLGDGRYFYFAEAGDDPLRTQLLKIFSAYHAELPLKNLLTVLGNPVRHRGWRLNLEVLEQCKQAYDEYCVEMGYYLEAAETTRICGPKLSAIIRDAGNPLAEILQSKNFRDEQALVDALRANGAPMHTVGFMKKFEELGISGSSKNLYLEYASLFWSDGQKKNKTYHTLDDQYGRSTVTDELLERAAPEEDYDRETLVTLRKEQVALRKSLLKARAIFDGSLQTLVAKCECCHRLFPADLLVAAHVKRRAECKTDELGDTNNIAMLLCVTCDKLYENGYFAVGMTGHIVLTKNLLHETVKNLLREVDGKRCEYWFVNDRRRKYCADRHSEGNFI